VIRLAKVLERDIFGFCIKDENSLLLTVDIVELVHGDHSDVSLNFFLHIESMMTRDGLPERPNPLSEKSLSSLREMRERERYCETRGSERLLKK
jgi:hypothetical protein